MVDFWYERKRVPRLGRLLSFDPSHRLTNRYQGECDPICLIEQTRKEHSWQNLSDPILSACRCATSPPRVRSTRRCWASLSMRASTLPILCSSIPARALLLSAKQK